MGYFDEDEGLYIMDRIKELIKYKGFQAAKEMESTVPKIYKLLLILTMSFILLKTFLLLILVRTSLPQPSISYTL